MSTSHGPDNDDMTMPEREQWLLDRGVQIEKSGSEIASKIGSELTITEQIKKISLNKHGGSQIDGVQFVHVPYDTSKPITEVTLPSHVVESLGPAGDLLPAYVKSYFADGKVIDEQLFREQAGKQNLIGGGTDQPINVSSQAMMNATLEGSVETFPLVRPSSTNKHQGVYIYLDEVGMLKNLPLNFRASKIAGQCGYHPEPKFYGDIFIGRVEAKPTHYMHNISIKVEDVVNTSSEWLVNAPRENLEWTQALDDATNGTYRKNNQQVVNDGTDGISVQVNKDDGTSSFSWLQNSDEVEVTLPLQPGSNKKLIRVSFLRKKVDVKYDGSMLLKLELYEEVDVDGCTWTLENDKLVITCEKFDGGKIWPRIEA